MLNKIKQIFSAIVLAISSFILVAYISIFPFAFNPASYSRYYDTSTVEASRLSIDTLKMLIARTLDFALGKIDEFQTIVKTIDNESINAFTNHAVAHMYELRNVFTTSRVIVAICLFIFLLTLAYIIIKKKIIEQTFYNTLLISLGLIFLIIASILVYSLFDFSTIWVVFHFLVFDNYNWILDNNEILGLIMPEKGFYLVVSEALSTYLFITIIEYFIIRILKKKIKK